MARMAADPTTPRGIPGFLVPRGGQPGTQGGTGGIITATPLRLSWEIARLLLVLVLVHVLELVMFHV